MTNSPTLPGSRSIESHLSRTNQRCRLPSSCNGSINETSNTNILPKHTFDLPLPQASSSLSSSNFTHRFNISHIIKPLVSSRTRPSLSSSSCDESSLTLSKRLYDWMFTCIKITLVLYCCFCLFFAPIVVYSKGLRNSIPRTLSLNVPQVHNVPSMVSDAQKLSLTLSSHTIPPFVTPFVKRGLASNSIASDSITLCLWDYESNVSNHNIHRLSLHWKGPISLVLLSPQPTRSGGLDDASLEVWKTSTVENIENISIHLVNVTHKQLESISPNVYLNLARLLSSTDSSATFYTMLFPGDISRAASLVSSDMLTKISESVSPLPNPKSKPAQLRPIVSIVSSSGSGNSSRFAVYPSSSTADESNSLSPLLIPHHHPRWCTERFTFSISRKDNWDVCLWQVWLDAAGRVETIEIDVTVDATDGVAGARTKTATSAVNGGGDRAGIDGEEQASVLLGDFATKIHRQQSLRLKAEMCDLSIKKLALLGANSASTSAKAEKRNVKWLRGFCQQEFGPRDEGK